MLYMDRGGTHQRAMSGILVQLASFQVEGPMPYGTFEHSQEESETPRAKLATCSSAHWDEPTPFSPAQWIGLTVGTWEPRHTPPPPGAQRDLLLRVSSKIANHAQYSDLGP